MPGTKHPGIAFGKERLKMRVGIIGMGNMGSKYAGMIVRGNVAGMELVAITRVNDERWDTIKEFVSPELVRVNSGDEMFALVD
jgi:predicted homoserine dehydrogenase-like protein